MQDNLHSSNEGSSEDIAVTPALHHALDNHLQAMKYEADPGKLTLAQLNDSN
jgi:hypothetical protein